MSDEQRKSGWLARWRAKHPREPHRTAMDKLFSGADGDSSEKVVPSATPVGARNLRQRTRRASSRAAAEAADRAVLSHEMRHDPARTAL